VAERLGGAAELDGARELVERNGALGQREVVEAHGDVRALGPWLAGRFGDGL
jgi:hypothetical protein